MQNFQSVKAPEALRQMLGRYRLQSLQDYKNAIQEIIQEIALLGLWRAKFFEKAAFYGGTALRILYELDRFSEDLDFTLLKPDLDFDLATYETSVKRELESLGFKAEVQKKLKTQTSSVDSAFIKVNTIEHLLLIGLPSGLHQNLHPQEILKIRFEVDRDPPLTNITTENKLLLLPIPFTVKTLKIEDLFAGKIHAALCREWKGRVKGRDWYDLVWFVARKARVNLTYLEERMRQSNAWTQKRELTPQDLLKLFKQKIENLDVQSAQKDIINFIGDSSQIDLWSKDFFLQIIQRIQF